jgi:hypothetical protein
MTEPVGGLDAPDGRGEVGKGVRMVLLDDWEDRGRYALGGFVIGQTLTILNDLLPVFRGQRFSLCLQCED